MNFSIAPLSENIASGGAGKNVTSKIDIDKMELQVQLLLDNPEVTSSGFKDGFISLYDLQNSIMGIKFNIREINNAAVFKLDKITFFTGYKFLRETTLIFSPNDIKERCCGEIYARRILPEEIN